MSTPPTLPSAEDAVELPVEVLAMQVLKCLADGEAGSRLLHRSTLILLQANQAQYAYAEAWDWLETHNLIGIKPGETNGWGFVTRRGRQIAASQDSLRELQASERINVDLHPRVKMAVGPEFILGRFEMAALAAMREVEIRVREMSGVAPSDRGVALMRQAFKDGGALADATSDAGEREATSALFAGAIGVFKNPSSHRQIDFDDPTEAAEVVLLADLLMRLLDRREGDIA